MHATTEQEFLPSMPCTTLVQTVVYKQSKNKKMAEPRTGGCGCISAREGLFTSPCYVRVQERFKHIAALRHISWLWQLPNLWISSQNWQLRGGEALRILHYLYYSTKMWAWHNVPPLTQFIVTPVVPLCRMSSDHAGLLLWPGYVSKRSSTIMEMWCVEHKQQTLHDEDNCSNTLGGVYCAECTLICCCAVFLLF